MGMVEEEALVAQDEQKKDQSLPENVNGYFISEVLNWEYRSLRDWIDNPDWDGVLPCALLLSLYFLKMKFIAFIAYIVLNKIDENPELVSFQAFYDANGYVFL